jgi:hypothetical protein
VPPGVEAEPLALEESDAGAWVPAGLLLLWASARAVTPNAVNATRRTAAKLFMLHLLVP